MLMFKFNDERGHVGAVYRRGLFCHLHPYQLRLVRSTQYPAPGCGIPFGMKRPSSSRSETRMQDAVSRWVDTENEAGFPIRPGGKQSELDFLTVGRYRFIPVPYAKCRFHHLG